MKGLCHGAGREGREGKEWITLPRGRCHALCIPDVRDACASIKVGGKPYGDAAAEGGENQGMRRKGKSILLVRTVRLPFRQKAGGKEQSGLRNQDDLGDIRA